MIVASSFLIKKKVGFTFGVYMLDVFFSSSFNEKSKSYFSIYTSFFLLLSSRETRHPPNTTTTTTSQHKNRQI